MSAALKEAEDAFTASKEPSPPTAEDMDAALDQYKSGTAPASSPDAGDADTPAPAGSADVVTAAAADASVDVHADADADVVAVAFAQASAAGVLPDDDSDDDGDDDDNDRRRRRGDRAPARDLTNPTVTTGASGKVFAEVADKLKREQARLKKRCVSAAA